MSACLTRLSRGSSTFLCRGDALKRWTLPNRYLATNVSALTDDERKASINKLSGNGSPFAWNDVRDLNWPELAFENDGFLH